MKPIEDLKHELREKVPLGIDLTLQALKVSIPEDLPKYNDIILLESRYRELNANLLKGLIENEEAQVEFNKLRESILTFINDLREEDFVKELAEKAQEKARTGKVLYRVPDQMQVQKEEKCIIRVAFDEIILMRDLEKEADDTIKDVRIAEVMGAEILDPNETPTFAIRTFSEKVQFIDESDFTEWLFYVKPLIEGTFPLLLKVSIVEIVDGKERMREVVLEETIQVISTKPEVTVEEKLAVSGLELQSGQSDSSVTSTSSGSSKKIGTTAAAGVLAAIVLAIIAIWTFYPQLNPKEDADYVYGPKSGEDDWNKIKDSNDSTALINFRADYPESEYADLALNRLESLRFQVEAVSKGDSIYFEATSGNYPMQLAFLDAEGNVVQEQTIASAAELMNVKLAGAKASNITKVMFTDANGVKREVLLPENEAVKDITSNTSNNSKATDKPNKSKSTKKTNANNSTNSSGTDNSTASQKANTDKTDATNSTPAETVPIYTFANVPRTPIYKSCYSKRLERAKDDRLLKELLQARECTEKRIPDFVENQLSRVIESSSTNKPQKGNISFVIEADGSVTVQKIDSSFDKNFAEKARKAIEDLPKFIPGQDANGNPTKVLYILPITLKGQ